MVRHCILVSIRLMEALPAALEACRPLPRSPNLIHWSVRDSNAKHLVRCAVGCVCVTDRQIPDDYRKPQLRPFRTQNKHENKQIERGKEKKVAIAFQANTMVRS